LRSTVGRNVSVNSESVDTSVDHVAVVGQDLELDHVERLLRRAGQVERLNGRPLVVVSEVALKQVKKVNTIHNASTI
jgi:hypothetical protein